MSNRLRRLDNLFVADHGHDRRRGSDGRRRSPLRILHFPYLGLALGTVAADSLPELEKAALHVTVLEPPFPEVSLVKPVAAERWPFPQVPSWGVRRLGVEELWRRGLTGARVRVGHLDTGVDAGHQALRGRVAAYALFDDDGKRVRDAESRDRHGHGTHTAATIVGGLTSKGRFGVAPGATLISAEVIEGGDIHARVLGGLEWMATQDVRVINLSLGVLKDRMRFHDAIEGLAELDILCVAAVGNEGHSTARSPGDYRNVISVGALDQKDRVAGFSGSLRVNRAETPPPYHVPLLVAPGVGVVSAVPKGGYMEMDGTSMAAPHVSGLAALLRQAAPRATAAEIRAAILASCTLPAGATPDRAGHGVPSAPGAYAHLRAAGLIDQTIGTAV